MGIEGRYGALLPSISSIHLVAYSYNPMLPHFAFDLL